MSATIIAARYPGKCRVCHGVVAVHDIVLYDRQLGVTHEACAFPPAAPKAATETEAQEFVEELREAARVRGDAEREVQP